MDLVAPRGVMCTMRGQGYGERQATRRARRRGTVGFACRTSWQLVLQLPNDLRRGVLAVGGELAELAQLLAEIGHRAADTLFQLDLGLPVQERAGFGDVRLA